MVKEVLLFYRFKSILIALFLFAVFALPNINQWSHLSGEHQTETSCVDNSTHFHTIEVNCTLIATFISPHTLTEPQVFSLQEQEEYACLIQSKGNLFHVITRPYFNLRGPPINV